MGGCKEDWTNISVTEYYGSQAYQLFLEAYQLILWKQCHALIHQKGIPAELEVRGSLFSTFWCGIRL